MGECVEKGEISAMATKRQHALTQQVTFELSEKKNRAREKEKVCFHVIRSVTVLMSTNSETLKISVTWA